MAEEQCRRRKEKGTRAEQAAEVHGAPPLHGQSCICPNTDKHLSDVCGNKCISISGVVKLKRNIDWHKVKSVCNTFIKLSQSRVL